MNPGLGHGLTCTPCPDLPASHPLSPCSRDPHPGFPDVFCPREGPGENIGICWASCFPCALPSLRAAEGHYCSPFWAGRRAWPYHVQLCVAVIHWHIQASFHLLAHMLEEAEDGHLDGPQLPGFLGSCFLHVSPARLLRGEEAGSTWTRPSKDAASALETLIWRP